MQRRSLAAYPLLFVLLGLEARDLIGSSDSSFSFADVTAEAGIRFLHRNSPTPHKYFVETMGSGCAFLDFDADGHPDIFLVNGGWTPGTDKSLSFDHTLQQPGRWFTTD